MNLAIRGIDSSQIFHGNTFHDDKHPDLKADYILANPPFNISEWGGKSLKDDPRWKFAPPPPKNANFAWVQHIIHHLSPNGVAGFVLANGSMTSRQNNEGEIRKKIIEERLVDCMVALPGQLFYSTQIPACLWFIARNRANGKFRNRINEILFISASKMGQMVSRTHRELTNEEIKQIAKTYHAWRGENYIDEYNDIPGFCKSATIEEVRQYDYMLTPGRYVGVELQREDDEIFEDKMSRLSTQWFQSSREAKEIDQLISSNLGKLGFTSRQENEDPL